MEAPREVRTRAACRPWAECVRNRCRGGVDLERDLGLEMGRNAYNGSISSNTYTLTYPIGLRGVDWAVRGLSPFVVALVLEG